MNILFTSASLKRLFFFFLTTAITFCIFSQQHDPQAYWLVWTALPLSLITAGDTFIDRLGILLLTAVAAALAAMLTAAVAIYTPLLACSLLLLTISGMAAAYYWPQYYLSIVIIILSAIMSSGFAPPYTDVVGRTYFMLVGLGIALFCQLLFMPFYLKNQIRFVRFIALLHLQELNREIFSCLLQLEYADNIYLFERRLHLQKNKCVNAIERMRKLVNADKSNEFVSQLTCLSRLYEGMLDYAQLRRRVSDVNTFAVCKDEFTGLSQAINKAFTQLMRSVARKKHTLDLETLAAWTRRMEESYHHVVQIAAREPLVFLLFIASLNSFRAAIQNFYDSIQQVRLQ